VRFEIFSRKCPGPDCHTLHHIVSDVEAVATEIALIRSGSLLGNASPEKLLAASRKGVGNGCPLRASREFKTKWLVSALEAFRRSAGPRGVGHAPDQGSQMSRQTLKMLLVLRLTRSPKGPA